MSPLNPQSVAVSFKGQQIKVAVVMADRSAEWIVGLHGIQSNKALYEGLFGQKFADDYSLLAIDFVGFGDSDKPEDFSYDVADQVAVAKEVLNQLSIERMHLVGHSLGGMVGTLLLSQLGDRVLSFANLEGNLVLADCGASADAIKFSLGEFESVEYARMLEAIEKSAEPSAVARSRWLKQVPAKVFYKTSVSIVEWSKGEKLRELFNGSVVRRLFIYGSKNASKAEVVSDIMKKAEIPNAGHPMLLDNPEACYEALRTFITEK